MVRWTSLVNQDCDFSEALRQIVAPDYHWKEKADYDEVEMKRIILGQNPVENHQDPNLREKYHRVLNSIITRALDPKNDPQEPYRSKNTAKPVLLTNLINRLKSSPMWFDSSLHDDLHPVNETLLGTISMSLLDLVHLAHYKTQDAAQLRHSNALLQSMSENDFHLVHSSLLYKLKFVKRNQSVAVSEECLDRISKLTLETAGILETPLLDWDSLPAAVTNLPEVAMWDLPYSDWPNVTLSARKFMQSIFDDMESGFCELQLGTLRRRGLPGVQWNFSIVVSRKTLTTFLTLCDDPDDVSGSECSASCSDSDVSLQYDDDSSEHSDMDYQDAIESLFEE